MNHYRWPIQSFILTLIIHTAPLWPFWYRHSTKLQSLHQGQVQNQQVKLKMSLLTENKAQRVKKGEKNREKKIEQVLQTQNSSLNKNLINQGQQTLLAQYASIVRNLIAQNKYYPIVARKLGQEGRVEVSFEILWPNKIQNIQINKGCEYENLNQSALKAVNTLDNIPPIPQELQLDKLSLVIPIEFKLI